MTEAQVVIVAVTQYENVHAPRLRSALQMVLATKLGRYPVIIVDDSLPIEVNALLMQAGADVARCRGQRGLGRQQRQVIQLAVDQLSGSGTTGKEVIVLTQPEKYDIIRFIPAIIEPIVAGEAGIVLPVRTQKSWETYPSFQQESEKRINSTFQECIGLELDTAFGVFVFSIECARYFLEYNGERYGLSDWWDSHQVPPLIAHADGVAVAGVEVDFIYPPEQRRLEENDESIWRKRLQQEEELKVAFRRVRREIGL